GVAPPPTTAYRMPPDGAVILAVNAKERASVQPLASATANGAARAEVKVGEAVRFVGTGEMTPGLGTIVAAEWDFTGLGPFQPFSCDGSQEKVTVEATHIYDQPGTYFAS